MYALPYCNVLIYALLFTVALAQRVTIEPDIYEEIFGTPPPTPSTDGVTPLDENTVEPTPTDNTSTLDDNDACKCVPYYLCKDDVDMNDVNMTGFGKLDIRFGEEDCQESVEICCKNMKSPDEVVTPPPDPSRLRGCGYRNPNGLDFTITGGTGGESQFGEFPWVVAILDALNGTYMGVGALIHPQVVMTGAHIAYRYGPGKLKIRAGEWDTQTVNERLKYQERIAKEIYIHQGFKPKIVYNDIALLLLEKPVELADHINVLCMPSQDENFDNSKGCIANGWGKDTFGAKGHYAVILKKVEVDMVPHNRCTELLKKTRLGHKFRLHKSFVCAGGKQGKDTCQGDGGAPLACPIGDDRYKLTGLVSWGIGCGQKDVPAVYVNVPMFRTWVDDKMAAWGLDTSGYRV